MTKETKQSYIREFQQYKDEIIEKINDYAAICDKKYLIMLYGTFRVFHYNIKTEIGYIVIDGIKIKALEYKYRRISLPKLNQ